MIINSPTRNLVEFLIAHHDNDWDYGYKNDRTKIRLACSDKKSAAILRRFEMYLKNNIHNNQHANRNTTIH